MVFVEGLGLLALVGLVVVLPILGLRDASKRPSWVWEAAGESKSTWTALFVCSFVFFVPIVSLVGVAGTAVYWMSRRAKLVTTEANGKPPEPQAFVDGIARPGWYPDPAAPDRLRWWNGQSWMGSTSALPA
jgi:hypothetical protein